MAQITLAPISITNYDGSSLPSAWTGLNNLLNNNTTSYAQFSTTNGANRGVPTAKYDIKSAINRFSKINVFYSQQKFTLPVKPYSGLFVTAGSFKHLISSQTNGPSNSSNIYCEGTQDSVISSITNMCSASNLGLPSTRTKIGEYGTNNASILFNAYYYSYNGWNDLEVSNYPKVSPNPSTASTNYTYRLYSMPLTVDYTPPSLISPEILSHDSEEKINVGGTFEVKYNIKVKIYQKAPINLRFQYSQVFSIENTEIQILNDMESSFHYIINEGDTYYNNINEEYNFSESQINITPSVGSNIETVINMTIILTLKVDSFITQGLPWINVWQNITPHVLNDLDLPTPTNPVFENINRNNFEFKNDSWNTLSGENLDPEIPMFFPENNFELSNNMGSWIEEPSKFIGPIKLSQSHDADVTNTTTNTLIKKQYKNRKLLGKEGNYDEQITMGLRLERQKMVTLQGLVELDRPVIVNTCPNCPEDDPLNHKGFVVIHSVNNIKQINPRIYEADVKVEYIERNLQPVVRIQRGTRVNTQFIKPDIPETIILNNYNLADNNFTIINSGSFSYNNSELAYYNRLLEDEEPENRDGVNKIQLDKNESFIISRELMDPTDISICFEHLIPNSTVDFSDVERIIRIKNKDTGETLFEYQHLNFIHKGYDSEIDEEDITLNEADVVATVFNNITDEETNVLQGILEYDYDIERDESENYAIDGDYKGYWTGSKIHIRLDDNILNLTEDGLSGAEVNIDDLEIEDADYIIEFETKYPTNQMYYNELLTRLGIEITENVSTVQKKSMYSNMIVSPSPLSGRNLYFARFTEEGSLYYYSYDGYNGEYITTPFTEWKNSVNMQNADNASILSLKNNPSVVVMNNGLVKSRFDRYYNYITISKYREFRDYIPPTTDTPGRYILNKGWQDICRLKIDDIRNIKKIDYSPDKIILDVGGTIWTMWRGRPFIDVFHTNKDIKIMDKFDRLWNNNEITNINPNIESNIDYENYPYIKLSNSIYNYNPETKVDYRKGIGIIRPNYADISNKIIPMNSKTVFMPYFEKCYEHDTCENMLLEYMNLFDQTIAWVR